MKKYLQAKMESFAMLYGTQNIFVSEKISILFVEAKRTKEKFFKSCTKLNNYMKGIINNETKQKND